MRHSLHIEIADEILRVLREENLPAGTRIGEQTFARRLGVSRTPVRRALSELAESGILRQEPNRGFLVENTEASFASPGSSGDDLMVRIMADRASSRIAQDVSESELIQRYGMSRGAVRKALQRLAVENLVFRQRGHGWRFVDSLDTASAIAESYAFRIEIECAALRQERFEVDTAQFQLLREAHLAFVSRLPDGPTKEEWFRINAEFHEAIGRWSKNRFFLRAIQQQNSLRRMHQYADFGTLSPAEIRQSCDEHLAILTALEAGNRGDAERQLRAHLANAAME